MAAKVKVKNIKQQAVEVAEKLKKEHPSPKTELNYKNEYQLAVAVMLSAQTTDKKVNQVTPGLFKKYPDWKDLAKAQISDVRDLIHGVNFHLGKAERLILAGQKVVRDFAGKLPKSISELVTIPGIARKSANVIQQELWDISEGIVVDTHVTRVSNRLGLTANKEPVKIEKDLMAVLPKEYWRNFSGSLVLHGRYVCVARKPRCGDCVLNKICPSAFNVE